MRNIRHQRHPFFLRQWRLHRNLTQQKLADRLETTASYISQLETGQRGYTDILLERLADALMCEPGDLLVRDPTNPNDLWHVLENIVQPEDRPKAIAMLRTVFGEKTGT